MADALGVWPVRLVEFARVAEQGTSAASSSPSAHSSLSPSSPLESALASAAAASSSPTAAAAGVSASVAAAAAVRVSGSGSSGSFGVPPEAVSARVTPLAVPPSAASAAVASEIREEDLAEVEAAERVKSGGSVESRLPSRRRERTDDNAAGQPGSALAAKPTAGPAPAAAVLEQRIAIVGATAGVIGTAELLWAGKNDDTGEFGPLPLLPASSSEEEREMTSTGACDASRGPRARLVTPPSAARLRSDATAEAAPGADHRARQLAT